VVDQLLAAGIRAHFDDRTNYTPGWKYNHWYPRPPPPSIPAMNVTSGGWDGWKPQLCKSFRSLWALTSSSLPQSTC
jgi:hypothetical protein